MTKRQLIYLVLCLAGGMLVSASLCAQDLRSDLQQINQVLNHEKGISYEYLLRYYDAQGLSDKKEQAKGKAVLTKAGFYNKIKDTESVGTAKATLLVNHKSKQIMIYPPMDKPVNGIDFDKLNNDIEKVQSQSFRDVEKGIGEYQLLLNEEATFTKVIIRFDKRTHYPISFRMYFEEGSQEGLELMYQNLALNPGDKGAITNLRTYVQGKGKTLRTSVNYPNFTIFNPYTLL